MNAFKVKFLLNKYKKCPKCKSSSNLKVRIKDEEISLKCECGCVKFIYSK